MIIEGTAKRKLKAVFLRERKMPSSARTIDVKAYDAAHPNEKDWKASLPYTGRALTQNQVTLTTKATQKEPDRAFIPADRSGPRWRSITERRRQSARRKRIR